MAEVWLASDLTLDRNVAVKWLKPSLASDPVVAERFRREAVAAASLNHANIVAIHDVFEHDGRQAVVMQLVDGKSLRQLLDSQKRLSPELTCHIGACVGRALDHAHRAGFVHRDVKPGNIMLTPDGRVLLTDFGIAKALSGSETDLTSDNVMMGTAKYLSPEQVRGKRLDGRADLYSLGLVLYECLAGRVPFLGETDADTALARLQRDPTDLARLRATLPTGLVAIVHQLLSRQPQKRPATGAETAAALERAAVEGPPAIDPTDASASPVVPTGPGRLRRAASDHRGRAVDRRRATRPGFDPPEATDRADTPYGHTASAAYDSVADGSDDTPVPGTDNTPVAGPGVARGAPARGLAQHTRRSRALVIALVAIGALVAAMLWLSIRYGAGEPSAPSSVLPNEAAAAGGGDGAGDAGDEGTSAEAGATIAAVLAFDPDGDGIENDADAGNTIDGDPTTSWSTVCYSSQFLGGKRGVGVVVTFDRPTTAQLAVSVESAPYQINFYGSDAELPPLQFEGWGEALAPTSFDRQPGVLTSPALATPVRHVFVAFNEIAPSDDCSSNNPNQGRISEIRLVPGG
jgi:serine/threonine-protein kinase